MQIGQAVKSFFFLFYDMETPVEGFFWSYLTDRSLKQLLD